MLTEIFRRVKKFMSSENIKIYIFKKFMSLENIKIDIFRKY